MDKKEKRML